MQLCTSTSLHFCPHLADLGTEAGQQRFLGTGAALPQKAVLSAASKTCLSQMSVHLVVFGGWATFKTHSGFLPLALLLLRRTLRGRREKWDVPEGPSRLSMVRLLVSMGGGLSELHFLSPQLRTHLPSTGGLVAEAVALTCPWPPVAQSLGPPFLRR